MNSLMEKDLNIMPKAGLRCRVCNDLANGIHYGVVTCEGCKGFFKRCVKNQFKFEPKCNGSNGCNVVGTKQRIKCKSCRLKACLEAGMCKEGIRFGRRSKLTREQISREIFSDGDSKDGTTETIKPKANSQLLPFPYRSIRCSGIMANKLCENGFDTFQRHDNWRQLLIFQAQRAFKTSILQSRDPKLISPDLFEEAIVGYMHKLGGEIKQIYAFYSTLPGLDQLDIEDLAWLMKANALLIHDLLIIPVFLGGEFYYFLPNDIHFGRDFLQVLWGGQMIPSVVKTITEFNELKITDQELSILIVYLFLSLNITDYSMFKSSSTVRQVAELYRNAFIDVTKANKRTKLFYNKLESVIKTMLEMDRHMKQVHLSVDENKLSKMLAKL